MARVRRWGGNSQTNGDESIGNSAPSTTAAPSDNRPRSMEAGVAYPAATKVQPSELPRIKDAESRRVLSGFRVSLASGQEGEVEFVATSGEILVNLDNGRPQQRPWFDETPREWIEGIWPQQVWTKPEDVRMCGHHHQLRERRDVADYRHAMRCLRGQAEGASVAEMAQELNRTTDWIQGAVSRGVPQKPKNLEHWDPEGFCEVRYLKRRYHQLGLYETIVQGVEWEQDRVWRVHKETNNDWGLRTVKQCEKGNCGRSLQRVPDSSVKVGPKDSLKAKGTQSHSNWSCSKQMPGCVKPDFTTPVGDMFYWWCPKHQWYVCQHCQEHMPDKPTSKQIRHWYRGECQALDDLVFKVVEDFNLPDPGALPGDTARYTIKMNWYPDGMSQVTDHRHDNWTILVSLGASRVLNADYARVLMDDGDVILFGTQKHGVPVAAPDQGGRLSLVMMFSPDQHVEKAALHLAGHHVRGFQRIQRSLAAHDSLAECGDEPGFDEEQVRSLCALGFTEVEAEQALAACDGHSITAANLLLGS